MARPVLELASSSPLGPALVRWLVANGHAPEVLAGTGLDARDMDRDETSIAPTSLAAAFDRVAEAAAEPNLGFRLPSELPFRRYDAATLAARSAPTPRAALEAVARFAPLVFPSLVAEVVVEHAPRGHELVFRASFPGHPRGLGFRVEAYLVALALGLGRRGEGPFVPKKVHFVSARKGDVGSIALATGTSDIDFGADATGFSVALDDAERTIASADPLLGAMAEALARDALVSVPRSAAVARAVDARLLSALPRIPEAEEIARAMGMSERTLQRRLEAEGTRFSARIDAVREAEARRRTRDGNEALATIAIALGFGDVPAFSRAFKRWTGMPPGTYRRSR